MNIGDNIKRIRTEKGIQQKKMALDLGLNQSNYSKIENGKREPSIELINKLSDYLGVTVNDLFNEVEQTPKEVTVEDKNLQEQMKLIQQLDEEDRFIVFRMIDKLLTTKKFKDFFNKNIAAL
jgi:transcriptional regulator with XRE-family HTH domain